MRTIDFINDQYNSLRKGLKNYIAQYDHHGDDWRMAEGSRLLDLVRHVQQVSLNIIYRELSGVESVRPLIEQAGVDHDVIDEMLETIINVHVDEPKHEYYEKMLHLYEVVERLYEKDEKILQAYDQNVHEDRQREIDRLFNEMILRQATIQPLV